MLRVAGFIIFLCVGAAVGFVLWGSPKDTAWERYQASVRTQHQPPVQTTKVAAEPFCTPGSASDFPSVEMWKYYKLGCEILSAAPAE